MVARLLRWFDALAAAGLVVGMLVQSTLRDAWPVTSLIFYATPWPVLAIAGIWLGWRWRRVHRLWIAPVTAALFAFAMWIATDWKMNGSKSAQAGLRVVHWNVARPTGRLSHVVQQLREFDADVIAVAEAMPKGNSTVARWQTEFPGYEAAFSVGEMLCLVRGEIQRRESGRLGPSSYYTALDVTVRGHVLTIIQVDLIATPWRSRREPLEELAKVVSARTDHPLVVLGDFNTPRGSMLFQPLRTHLTHAWEEAGQGCAETWPMPVPVLSLDHVWLGHLRTVKCEHGVSGWSDHRPVIVDLAWQ